MNETDFNPYKPERGLHVYEWDAGLTQRVICWIYAEAGSDGGPDEPPEPEVIEVCNAWLGTVDLMPILDADQLENICDGFAQEHKDLADDARIDAWEAAHDY